VGECELDFELGMRFQRGHPRLLDALRLAGGAMKPTQLVFFPVQYRVWPDNVSVAMPRYDDTLPAPQTSTVCKTGVNI
jgi:hypothetical protein